VKVVATRSRRSALLDREVGACSTASAARRRRLDGARFRPSPQFDTRQFELACGNSIKDGRSIAGFHAYLKRHPKEEFAEVASPKIAQLTRRVDEAETRGPFASTSADPVNSMQMFLNYRSLWLRATREFGRSRSPNLSGLTIVGFDR
jgi:hypothetical protein